MNITVTRGKAIVQEVQMLSHRNSICANCYPRYDRPGLSHVICAEHKEQVLREYRKQVKREAK